MVTLVTSSNLLSVGKERKRTVYIDSPLLKTEMTVREMNHIYHSESLKHSIKKNGQKHIFHLMTELPANEKPATSVGCCIIKGLLVGLISDSRLILCFVFLNQECSKRNVVSFENDALDFEVDLTELETFGETTAVKKPKKQELQDSLKITTQPTVSETVGTKTKPTDPHSDEESEEEASVDSDEGNLVIDDSAPPTLTTNKQPPPHATPHSAEDPLTPESKPARDEPETSSPQKPPRHGRQSRRHKESGDQLSEILRMQTAMFNPANSAAKSSAASQESNPPSQSLGPSVHLPVVSLVKPCVTSYLERIESVNFHEAPPVVNVLPEHKSECPFDFSFGLIITSMLLIYWILFQNFCRRTCRLVLKMSKTTKLQKKAI